MTAGMDSLLDIVDLKLRLKVEGGTVPVIDGVSLSVRPGQVLALVGESGSGKSVTAQSILRLLPRSMPIAGGQILFRDGPGKAPVDLATVEPDGTAMQAIRGNRIAMIFQEPMSSFSPVHSIGSQIGDVLRLHRGLKGAALRAAIADLLDKVGIPNPSRALDRFPHEFSGGMRQRAMIAKALACNPALLIADEPTTALDVTIQAQILELIRGLKAELGMAVIFITHDLGIVAQMADEVAIMYTGRIVEQGPVRTIFRNPGHPYTADLLRAVPRLGGLGGWRSLKSIQGSVPSLYAMPQGCSFHPRCGAFMPGRCDAAAPDLYAAGADHRVRCYLHEPPRLELAS